MLVAGSISATTQQQLLELAKLQDVTCVEMAPLKVLGVTEIAERERRRCYGRLLDGLSKGHDVALYLPSSRSNVAEVMRLAQHRGMSETHMSQSIVASLAQIAKQVIDVCPLRGLVLTGGDTAKAICDRIGGRALLILGEVEAGIPLCQLIGQQSLLVITKAGAFGSQLALVNCLRILKSE